MTADEILVGIDNSPSLVRPVGQLHTPDRPEQRFAPLIWSTAGGTRHVR